MRFLVFQLRAPLASWGEPATGVHRDTASHPSWSAIVGMLGSACGVAREDEPRRAALRDGLAMAVATFNPGGLLRDFHTAQVPKATVTSKHRGRSRKEELAAKADSLHTTTSWRDHRADAGWVVSVARVQDLAACPSLGDLATALERPRHPLFLGRRACPPSAPLWPLVLQAPAAAQAMEAYVRAHDERLQEVTAGHRRLHMDPWSEHALAVRAWSSDAPVQAWAFDERLPEGEPAADLRIDRHDWPLHGGRRQFGVRRERVRWGQMPSDADVQDAAQAAPNLDATS